jgi:uncharacterized MnhB-related membrane protein
MKAVFEIILMLGLIVCAVAANFTKKLLPTIIIYAAFGTMLSVIWLLLNAPDLAITEAAVGVGIDSILFLLALRSMHRIDGTEDDE